MKKKKIDRKKLFYTLGFFIFCVFGLTVAYAALSTTLNISGSANVTQSSWGITLEKYPISDFYSEQWGEDLCVLSSFKCVDNNFLSGKGSVLQQPTLTATSIKNFSLSLSIPGDEVVFLYKITNTGSIPAKLESVTEYTPTYTSVNNNPSDVLWVQNNIEYILMPFELVGANFEEFNVGDVLCPGETKAFEIYFQIPSSVTTIPTGAVEISNLGVDYVFVQADKSVCS